MSPFEPLGRHPYLILESEDARYLADFADMADDDPHVHIRSKPASMNRIPGPRVKIHWVPRDKDWFPRDKE